MYRGYEKEKENVGVHDQNSGGWPVKADK